MECALIKFLKRQVGVLAVALFLAAPVYSQSIGTVGNHCVAVGKGAGKSGLTSVCPSGSGGALIDNGAGADPSFGAVVPSFSNQSANTVFSGPASGVAAQPTFRALVGADLPNPAVATLGGVQSKAVVASNFLTGISVLGVVTSAQPAFSDISGSLNLATQVTGVLANANIATTLSGKTIDNNANTIQNIQVVPGGRLTLTSNTPVLTTTVNSATTIYYTFAVHSMVPIYDGTNWQLKAYTQLTNDTTQSATGKAGPAAVANNSNYDLFVWNDAGTLRLTRGPAWTSDVVRSLAISRVGGIWTNNASITNGPGANLGTYVGTVRSNGTATIDYQFGAIASGGTPAILGVYNAYNRVTVKVAVRNSKASWTYAVPGTWRAADGVNTTRISWVDGLAEDGVGIVNSAYCGIGTASGCVVGIGIDSTTAFSGSTGWQPFNATVAANAFFNENPGFGFHYAQAIETTGGAGTGNFYGTAGVGQIQSSFNGTFRQ